MKHLCFLHLTPNLNILYASKKLVKILGLTREKIYGKSIESLFSLVAPLPKLKTGSVFTLSTSDLEKDFLCEVIDVDEYSGNERIVIKADYLSREVASIKSYRNLPELVDTVTTDVNEIVYRFELQPQPHFVFINEAITKITGYTPEQHYEDYRFVYKYIHPDDKEEVEKLLTEGPPEDFQETTLRWITRDSKEIIVRHRIEKIVENGKYIGFKGVNTDITSLHEKIEEVKKISVVRKLLNDIANRFVNVKPRDLDKVINESMKELAEFVNADRFYLITYDLDNLLSSNTHEWCAPGVDPQIDELQDIPVDGIPQWLEAHLNNEILEIPDVLALSKDDNVRQILEPQGIKSLITFPVFVSGKLFAFVGIDSVLEHHTYTSAEKEVLILFAKVLGNAYEKKQYNEELMQTTEFLNELIEQNKSLIYVKNIDGVYMRVNRAWEKTINLKRERVLGNNDFDIFPEKIARQFKHNDDLVLSKGKVINVEEELNMGGNEKRYFITVKFPLRNKSGKIYALSGVSSEITKRKKAQFELEASEKRFKTLFVESSAPMALINPDTGYYEDFNPAFQEMYATGKVLHEKLHVTDFSYPKTGYFGDRLMNAQTSEFLVLRQENMEGELYHVSISSCLIEVAGKKLLYEVLFDVTSQMEYQRAIKGQNKKLKEIAWEQSHVVRSPLVRIMALIDYLEDEQLFTPEMKVEVEQIKKSMEELDAITRGIAKKADKTKINELPEK